jgi:hypothetical protein
MNIKKIKKISKILINLCLYLIKALKKTLRKTMNFNIFMGSQRALTYNMFLLMTIENNSIIAKKNIIST